MVTQLTITINVSTEVAGDALEHIEQSMQEIMWSIQDGREENYESSGAIEVGNWEKQWNYKMIQI